MPAASKKKASKQKATSSYTYTGCWTCRRRHIKCDEAKPACNRCIKGGFDCAGYDFLFSGANSSRTFRRPVAPGSSSHHQTALSAAQVTGYLDELDAATDSAQKGPFSVLSFTEGHVRTPSEQEYGSPTSYDVTELDNASSPGDSGYLSSHSVQTEEIVRSVPRSHPQSPPMVVEPYLFSVPPRQSELFEHWTTCVSFKLSPLSASSSNPFRYVYPSLAMEGMMALPDTAGPRLAVWHGICGTAAWSLSKLKPDNPVYRALSVHHDQLALRYIQQAIMDPEGVRDPAIPAAIMTCLTGDTISSRLDAWGGHLKGGFHCLLSVLAHQRSSSTISVLCEQYLLAASMAKIGTPTELRAVQNGIQSSYSYMEECHCIARPLINVILATNVLAKSNKRSDPTQVGKIRNTLLRSVPKRQSNLTRHHLSHVWYYAVAIYFTRTLSDPSETEQFAHRAMEHLEWARDADDNGSSGRIMMWPLLTIGLECRTPELRSRLNEWCHSQLHGRQQISNIDTFLSLLRDTFIPKPLTGPLPIREISTQDEEDWD